MMINLIAFRLALSGALAIYAHGRIPEEHEITNYKFYNQDYPVVFNIILWFSVSAIVALLFIGVSMWYMDPGRDSIIYRMTMTRAKKD